MKTTKQWVTKIGALLLAGVMSAAFPVNAYADTVTKGVVISDYGPVAGDKPQEQNNSVSETEAGENATQSMAENHPAGTSDSVSKGTENNSTALGTGNGFFTTEKTTVPNVGSNYAILVNADTNEIIVAKNATERFNPASMTKVMTLLVACEHVSDLKKNVTITQDIVDYVQTNGASHVGFKAGEVVSVQDLLYGLILPSGADAALALTRLIAGSEENFVVLMNQKAQALGIAGTTHFTNTTGLYNEQHYSTPKDIATIMNAASKNDLARAVLSAVHYTTGANAKHSTGIALTNLFLSRIAQKATGGIVNLAKTGYIAKAGNCSVSAFTAASGTHYIAVTGKAQGVWNCINDHVTLYSTYAR